MIFLSAGHHLRSQGARYRGWTEHQLATAWVEEIFSHYPDRFIKSPPNKLKEKVAFINEHESSSLAIDLHFNSFMIDNNDDGILTDDEHAGSGCETLYYPGSKKGMMAASMVQDKLSKVMGNGDRGIKEGWYRMDKSRGADFFLERTKCTALILEPAFIHKIELINSKMIKACETIANCLINIEDAIHG